MAPEPTRLDLKLLKRLSEGFVEPEQKLAGIGPKTIGSCIENGWAKRDTDDFYGDDGLSITEAGKLVLDKYDR